MASKDVLWSNFPELYSQIISILDEAVLIGVDCEFTGLAVGSDSKGSLFDSGQDRYSLLRSMASNFIICQIGLSAFLPIPNENRYNVHTYNFYLCPPSLQVTNDRFMCQVSSLEFLCQHRFDFNKFIYEGISYLSREKEVKLREELKHQNLHDGIFREVDERHMLNTFSAVTEWLVDAKEGDKLTIPCNRKLWIHYLQSEIRRRFNNVWTSQEVYNIVVEKITAESRTELQKSTTSLEDEMIHSIVGFSLVFQHLIKLKKPLVGHNMFTDLVMMYHNFYEDLPRNLSDFKTTIHRLFPLIYDTKHIIFKVRRELEDKGLGTSTDLHKLNAILSSHKGRYLALYSPKIYLGDELNNEDNPSAPHEAGYDACAAGTVFLRLSHIHSMKDVKSSLMRPLTPEEHIRGLRQFANYVNVIRANINYINLCGKDPEVERPAWLIVQTRNRNNYLNLSEVAQVMSRFGSIDLRSRSRYQAWVAVGNFRSAKDIVKAFRGDDKYSVTTYSWFRHSPIVRPIIWTSALLSGGLGLWILLTTYRNFRGTNLR